MLSISAPAHAKRYLEYTFFIVFTEWLGVAFQVKYQSTEYISLWFEDDESKVLNLNASFLNVMAVEGVSESALSHLSYSELDLASLNDDFGLFKSGGPELDLQVLFGRPNISVSSDISIEFDLFGTIFFMLSRFEELVFSARDEHGRFAASSSIAHKYGFLDRPIVDEYVELLWASISNLWPSLKRKRYKPQVFISCDVDTPFDPTVRNAYQLARTCFADIVKRKSLSEAIQRIQRYSHNLKGDYRFDSNYTFDWYMDVCERSGQKAAFYFIPTSLETNNGYYELRDSVIRDLLKKIDHRGHEIGVHGSYQTYRDGSKLIKQKQLLDSTLNEIGIKQKVKGNRQHYLRWDSSITPDLLDSAGFEYDTTGGYADHAGFRFGTSHEFSMWSWPQKKVLSLKQRPLIAMECTVIDELYMGLGISKKALEYMDGLKKNCVRYNGGFSILWHNSLFPSEAHKDCFRSLVGGSPSGE